MEKILLFKPYFSHTIWGGERLCREFGYDEPGSDVGECWGISAHPTGESIVDGGCFDGLKLSQLWDEHRELFGNMEGDRFPILVKIIDAKDDLSVQVHPDDKYALVHENGSWGKTESWYVLHSPDEGRIVIGHNATTREELCDMIDNGKWGELIRVVPVSPGDVIQIDPGTVHAMSAGLSVLETQTTSDITYRLYDYDRMKDGKKRPLHHKESKDVIKVPSKTTEEMVKRSPECPDNSMVLITDCRYYKVARLKVKGEYILESGAPFLNASVLEGSGTVLGTEVKKGTHMIITSEGVKRAVFSGDMDLIVSTVEGPHLI